MLSRVTQAKKALIVILILAANFLLFIKYAWNEAQEDSRSRTSTSVQDKDTFLHDSVLTSLELKKSHFERPSVPVIPLNPVMVPGQSVDDVTPPLLFYNRVPKTGSTTFSNIAYKLAGRNKFSMLHINVTYKNFRFLNILDQQRFVRNVSLWTAKQPALYHGHLHFLDFTRFGFRNPIYINIIRDPIERLVSYYYFLRYGDDYRPNVKRAKAKDTKTLDECLEISSPECDLRRMMWTQVPFFCGQNAQCLVPGRWALEQAKTNLVNNFLLVGVTEQLGEYIALLETMLPQYFAGAYDLYTNTELGHLRKTKEKVTPSDASLEIIKNTLIYKLEQEFYIFTKQQFNFLKERTMRIDKDGRAIINRPLFKYEKIV